MMPKHSPKVPKTVWKNFMLDPQTVLGSGHVPKVYHILWFHRISYDHIIWSDMISYYINYHMISYHILYHKRWCQMKPYHIIWYHNISYDIVSNDMICYQIAPAAAAAARPLFAIEFDFSGILPYILDTIYSIYTYTLYNIVCIYI